jgi:hypothetical protein
MSDKPFGKKPPAVPLADEWSTEPRNALEDMLSALKAAVAFESWQYASTRTSKCVEPDWLRDARKCIAAAERLREEDAWPPVL